MPSGLSTPVSPSTTLTNASETDALLSKERLTTLAAYQVLEIHASIASTVVFVYDLAGDVGIGAVSKAIAKDSSKNAPVLDLQTRPGAGSILAGRLSEGTSEDGLRGTVITAYTTPTGLVHIVPSLDLLPSPKSTARLVLQVAQASSLEPDFALSPSLTAVSAVLGHIPESFAVIFSATPQETIDLAATTYSIANAHVIHFFDHCYAAREIGKKRASSPSQTSPILDTYTALQKAGYSYFDYSGDLGAENVVVVLNGPLALVLKHIASVIPSFGVVVVRVLRPWDEAAFLHRLPKSARAVHIVEDGLGALSASPLFDDILGCTLNPQVEHDLNVRSHIISPIDLQQFITSAQSLLGFISSIIPVNWFAAPKLPQRYLTKQVVLWTETSSTLAEYASRPFMTHPGLQARLVSQEDTFSKTGGITQSTLLISPQTNAAAEIPLVTQLEDALDTDFIVVADPSLLRTHAVLKSARPHSGVLLLSAWSAEEVISNLNPLNLSIIRDKKLTVYLIDALNVAKTAGKQSTEVSIASLTLLRLYLGDVGKEDTLAAIGEAAYGHTIEGASVAALARAVWKHITIVPIISEELQEVIEVTEPSLKEHAFNAITHRNAENPEKHGLEHTTNKYDAVKHTVFREAYRTTGDALQLRPDLPETTFLVTCTVNRRLTPLEYNRNVFHLEFSSKGTGLKYAIGEALGVHGWNDADEVSEFLQWYGVENEQIITAAVAGDASKRHSRTAFQAFQQQIDIFGKPPKGFYEALAGYATAKEDRLALRFIAAPEGASTFKKLSELETVTFADVLRKFASAHPPVDVLCEIVGDIKPRHYSIASAQSAVGDQIDLLVVTVDWLTPSGT